MFEPHCREYRSLGFVIAFICRGWASALLCRVRVSGKLEASSAQSRLYSEVGDTWETCCVHQGFREEKGGGQSRKSLSEDVTQSIIVSHYPQPTPHLPMLSTFLMPTSRPDESPSRWRTNTSLRPLTEMFPQSAASTRSGEDHSQAGADASALRGREKRQQHLSHLWLFSGRGTMLALWCGFISGHSQEWSLSCDGRCINQFWCSRLAKLPGKS